MKEFPEHLASVAGNRDFSRHPFVVALNSGEYAPGALTEYAVQLVHMAEDFIHVLSQLLVMCQDPLARALLIENIAEENGLYVDPRGQKLRFDAQQRHPELARRFARSLGALESDLSWSPTNMKLSAWMDTALRSGNWLGVMAYITVGQELNAPSLFTGLERGLREVYGRKPEDIEFFTIHITADSKHGNEGVETISSVARSEQGRQLALEGARRGADALWAVYRRFDHMLRQSSDDNEGTRIG